jgi:hypothetical protein
MQPRLFGLVLLTLSRPQRLYLSPVVLRRYSPFSKSYLFFISKIFVDFWSSCCHIWLTLDHGCWKCNVWCGTEHEFPHRLSWFVHFFPLHHSSRDSKHFQLYKAWVVAELRLQRLLLSLILSHFTSEERLTDLLACTPSIYYASGIVLAEYFVVFGL